jgi:NAD(P)-dependent dehydrogenase (short-subunit alcohol dehydrogenase family)
MRNIVITGGGGGLGLVTARLFSAGGDRVYVCDSDAKAISELHRTKELAHAAVVDVSDMEQIRQFFAQIRSSADQIDVLINNVGVAGPRACLEDIDPKDWTNTINANLNAAFWTTREVLPAMKLRKSGRILNISTMSAGSIPLFRTPYVVSKAALESLTLNIAREAGPYQVTCNAVRPGIMDNERLKRILASAAASKGVTPEIIEAEALAYVSMRTKVTMDEVAAMIHFLASDAASHITGQIISVDGGVQWEA